MNSTTNFRFPTVDTVLTVIMVAGIGAVGVICAVTSGVQAVFA